jgi:hypothetical protein
LNDINKVGEGGSAVVRSGEVWVKVDSSHEGRRRNDKLTKPTFLMLLQAFPVRRDKTLGIYSLKERNEPLAKTIWRLSYIYSVPCLLFTKTLQREERQKLFGYTNPSGPGTKEQNTVLSERLARRGRSQLRSIHKSRKDDGA